jgi:hypothetical protein
VRLDDSELDAESLRGTAEEPPVAVVSPPTS